MRLIPMCMRTTLLVLTISIGHLNEIIQLTERRRELILLFTIGTGKLKELFPSCCSAISSLSGAAADLKLNDGDSFVFGERSVRAISTPGHTAVRCLRT